MCYQLIERYKHCHCIYYSHAIDRCSSYGRRGHSVIPREIIVGHACLEHSAPQDPKRTTDDISDSGYSSALPRSNKPFRKPQSRWNPTSPEQPRSADLLGRSDRGGASARAPKITPPPPDDEFTTKVNSRQASDDTGAIKTPGIGEESDCELSEASESSDASESSETSERKTVTPVATSTTPVNEDAVEAIFRRLMLFKDLRYLWPQLIARCEAREKCLQAIERLLRRYAEDLGQLAQHAPRQSEAVIFLSACRFVRK